jgi:hypothetical protein
MVTELRAAADDGMDGASTYIRMTAKKIVRTYVRELPLY